MKNKNIETIISVIVFIFVIILSFSFTIEKSKEATEKLYASPLTSVTILNNKIILEEDKRTYNAIVNCSTIEENTQIISYNLRVKSNDVIVKSNFFKDYLLLDGPSKDMTNFEINLSLRNEKQEVVYHFDLTCGV